MDIELIETNTLFEQLNNDMDYKDIFHIQSTIQNFKIKYIKRHMNKLIIDKQLMMKLNDYNIDNYLNNILSMLIESYPIMIKYIGEIINILKTVENYNIHPLMYQSIISNLFHAGFIKEKSKIPFATLQADIACAFSIFNDIFSCADDKFEQYEQALNYNNFSSMELNEFITMFNKCFEDKNISKVNKLNIYLISIEHTVENTLNDLSQQIEKREINTDDIFNEYTNILKQFDDLFEKSTKLSSNDFNNLIPFRDVNINDNIYDAYKRNILYFWTDTIATINNNLIISSYGNFI